MMQILNRIYATSFFLLILMPTTVAIADDLQTITVTATRAPSPDNPYYNVVITPMSNINQGPGYSEAMAMKAKYEAFGQCMNDLYRNKAACLTAASDNLLSNQDKCSKVAAEMVGVSAGVAGLVSLTGVGAAAGAVIVSASVAAGAVLVNQCNNTAQNIYNDSKIACDLSFDLNNLKCAAIKP